MVGWEMISWIVWKSWLNKCCKALVCLGFWWVLTFIPSKVGLANVWSSSYMRYAGGLGCSWPHGFVHAMAFCPSGAGGGVHVVLPKAGSSLFQAQRNGKSQSLWHGNHGPKHPLNTLQETIFWVFNVFSFQYVFKTKGMFPDCCFEMSSCCFRENLFSPLKLHSVLLKPSACWAGSMPLLFQQRDVGIVTWAEELGT